MTVGTALVVGKRALIARLQANATLTAAGVKISYRSPILPTDLKATDGDYEAIWLGDATTTNTIPVLTAGNLHRDETSVLDVMVQVIKPGTASDDGVDLQEQADLRAAEILTEIERTLANNVDLSVTDPARFEALFLGASKHVTGFLGNGGAYGSRFECRVEFTARLTPS